MSDLDAQDRRYVENARTSLRSGPTMAVIPADELQALERAVEAAQRRPSYKKAVEWVALNDDSAELDAEAIEHSVSVAFIADIWGVPARRVARDVLKVREADR